MLNERSKVRFRHPRLEYLGVYVAKGRRQVAHDHPIALYADDAGCDVERRRERDVGVGMRIARVGWTPGDLVGLCGGGVGRAIV